LFDSKGDEIECVDDDLSSTSENLLASFSDAIEGKSSDDWSYTEHLKHVSIIEAAYEADKLLTSCCPNKIFEKFFNDNNNMENVI
jgi:hypothetical protein